MSNTIDLSQLPAPSVIEEISFEEIYQTKLLAFRRSLGKRWNAALESDPIVKLLELMAWQEMVGRARTNDAASGVLLARAVGPDLDHAAALVDVARLVADPGDPDAVPQILPVMEKDDRLRMRAQMAFEGLSVAGPIGAYKFFALSASARVSDVRVESPAPAEVLITLLSTDDDGVADQELIDIVHAGVSAEDRRPVADRVTVQAAQIVTYAVRARLHVPAGPSSQPLLEASRQEAALYTAQAFRVGFSPAYSGIQRALHQPSMSRVEMLEPLADVVIGPHQAARCVDIELEVVDGFA